MDDTKARLPFLPFGHDEARPYGSIRLLDSSAPPLPFRYSKFTVDPGKATSEDRHAVLEVWVILSGNGRILYDGHEFAVAAGDTVQFDSLRTHQLYNDGPEDLKVFSFWWSNG